MTNETKGSTGFYWDNKVLPEGTVVPMLPHSEKCLSEKAIVKSRINHAEKIFYLACFECAKEGVMIAPTPLPSSRPPNSGKR